MKMLRLILTIALLVFPLPAFAQYRVVASCPGATDIQPAGSSGGSPVVDTKGNACGVASGGSTAATIADGADVAEGAKADAAWTSGSGSVIAILKNIAGGVGSAIPAGSAIIGKVGIDQTTPGTTNLVALAANQSVNTAQVNGVTTSAGTGAVGTGSQRVAVGTDTATIAGSAPGTAGSPSVNVVTVQGVTSGTALPTAPNPYPQGATPITASATGTTGATTATLAGTSGKTTYICGYSIRANATAAATVTNTITGVITATLSSIMWIAPLASGIGIDEMIFSPCIPASATNTAIAVVSGAPGSGGNVSSKGWGYQL